MYGRDRRGGSDRGFGHGGGGFDRGGFRSDFSSQKPIKIGEEYDVTITDVGAKGDGIAKVENFVVFVANGKKGEKCRIRIKEVANKFAIAEKVGASKESEDTESKDVEEEKEEQKEESDDEVEEDSEKESDEDSAEKDESEE